jgi:hypothetical protein
VTDVRMPALEDACGVTVVHRRMVGADRALCGITPRDDADRAVLVCARCRRSERVLPVRLAAQIRRLTRELATRLGGGDGEHQLVIDRLPDGSHRTALDVELERAGLVPVAS